jgi:hypothetical protein
MLGLFSGAPVGPPSGLAELMATGDPKSDGRMAEAALATSCRGDTWLPFLELERAVPSCDGGPGSFASWGRRWVPVTKREYGTEEVLPPERGALVASYAEAVDTKRAIRMPSTRASLRGLASLPFPKIMPHRRTQSYFQVPIPRAVHWGEGAKRGDGAAAIRRNLAYINESPTRETKEVR